MPSQKLIAAMQKYNEELVKADVLLAADGLQPSSSAIRISYPEPGGKPKMMDGPFTLAALLCLRPEIYTTNVPLDVWLVLPPLYKTLSNTLRTREIRMDKL